MPESIRASVCMWTYRYQLYDIKSIQKIITQHGKPLTLRCDNGQKSITLNLIYWASKDAFLIPFIQLKKPIKNTDIERFISIVQQKWLPFDLFEDIEIGLSFAILR